MDEIDIKILEILRENSRTTYTDIAKALELSEGTIRKRVYNLIRSRIIKRFTIETADEKEAKALVLITTNPSIPTPGIAEEVRKIRGVQSVFEIAGQYDIAISLSGKDIQTINQSVDKARRIEGVLRTNTLIVLRNW